MKRNDGQASISREQYLQSLADDLLNNCLQQKIQLTRTWASNFPSARGVYLFKYKGKIIYVGEIGNLRGRMKEWRVGVSLSAKCIDQKFPITDK